MKAKLVALGLITLASVAPSAVVAETHDDNRPTPEATYAVAVEEHTSQAAAALPASAMHPTVDGRQEAKPEHYPTPYGYALMPHYEDQ